MSAPTDDPAEVQAPWLTGALSLVALLLAARALSLATGIGVSEPEPPTAPSGQSHRVAVAAEAAGPRSLPGPRSRLTTEELAAIAGMCPTALNDLPPELLPREAQRQHAGSERAAGPPEARLTGVRLASRGPVMPLLNGPRLAMTADSPTESQSDGWLIEPEDWFVPEDQAAAVARPPASEPVPHLGTPSSDEQEPAHGSTDAAPAPWLGEPPSPAPTLPELPETEEAPARGFSVEGADADATPWTIDGSPATPGPDQEALAPPHDGWGGAEDPSADLRVEEEASGDAEVPAPELPREAAIEPSPPMASESYEDPPAPRWLEEERASEERFDPLSPEAMSDAGPSFAPPGVAPVEPVSPTPSEPAEKALPNLEDERLESPLGGDPEEEADSLRWGGEYDSVVPEPSRETAPYPRTEEEPETETPAGDEPERESLPSPAEKPSVGSPIFSPPVDPEKNLEPGATESVETPSPSIPQVLSPTGSAERVAEPIVPLPSEAMGPERPVFAAPQRPPNERPSAHPGGGAKAAAAARKAAGGKTADESHRELFAKNNYPSALECAACHQRIYDEWSVSGHAYAFVSPMFHKFEQTITELSNGTVGHFCQRCHSPVATAMYEPRSASLNDMAIAAREGVTCIVCHRVNQRWGKSNGERRIEPGDIYAPIYGGIGGAGVAKAIADKESYKVKASPHAASPENGGPGQPIHTEGRFFDQLTQAEACTSCHQVAVHPGVKLEVVWEQYRASPACKKGVTCQECHMGKVPGMAGGYNYGPIAELNGKTVNNHRKQSSHRFYGPGYSIAHPGVFPQNKDALKWAFNDWLAYDWRSGWGTDEFEDRIDEMEDRGVDTSAWFPKVWADPDDRADARDIIEDNLDRLKTKRRYRELVMENGSKVDGPFFREPPTAGRDLKFEYLVANQNEGHNLPTASLGAQPQLWANVVLIGPDGRRLWETGYTDSNGDLCDIHSIDVRHGRIPFDKQLFNLQTMFLITGATGTDREFYMPVNLDIDQVAHLRPGTTPFTVSNHPPFIRMEGRSIAPLGKKRVKYTVPAELMRQKGRYRLSFRLRNRTEPMYFMRLCKATPEMHRAMTEGTLDIHPQSVEFDVR